ncbi:Lsr2 family protein [Mycolicibacterium conceptionense]|uniref:histone-like nucleoid-structuring protein Lsr2 n=1 Tax=Mycolicibacterium conceptionense TaxID=451644 RepID=UPI003204F3B3
MGKIVTVEYVDDFDGISVDADTVDTVDFSYRGQDYSLVLTTENGAQFDKDMARYITAAKKAAARDARAARKPARPAPRKSAKVKDVVKAKGAAKVAAPRRATGSRKAATAASGRERSRAIREWAAANGHKVSQRGRLPAEVESAYDAAH